MVAVDFGHTSNPDKTGFGSSQRLLNAYPEALGEAAKSPLPVYAVPGTSRFDTGATGLNGPCRGMLYVYGKGLYVIAGNAVALFDDRGNATPVSGAVGGNSMAVMAANQRPTRKSASSPITSITSSIRAPTPSAAPVFQVFPRRAV